MEKVKNGKVDNVNGFDDEEKMLVYSGTMIKDTTKKHGYGVAKWRNGDSYQGIFENDMRNIRGKYHFSSLNSYTGEFLDGMI